MPGRAHRAKPGGRTGGSKDKEAMQRTPAQSAKRCRPTSDDESPQKGPSGRLAANQAEFFSEGALLEEGGAREALDLDPSRGSSTAPRKGTDIGRVELLLPAP